MAPLVLIASVSACEVGPDYHCPTSTLTAFHNAASLNAAATAPMVPLEGWWLGFKDPVLASLIRQALQQNLDLAAAFGRVQQAWAASQAAGARLLPTFDADPQMTALRQSLNSPLGEPSKYLNGYRRDQRVYDVGLAATWEIDLAGGLRRGSEAARAEAHAAEADSAGVRITVAAEVADAYFQIRGDQARISVVQKQIDVDRHLVDLVGQLHGRGLANEREFAQAQAVLQQVQATLPLLEIGLNAQMNRLDVLLGAQPGTYASKLSANVGVPLIPAIPVTDTPEDFLRRRPDIVAAEQRVVAANARIGVALSDYYPKLSLSGVLGFDSLSATHLFTAASFQPIGTGAIRWRLFDFGKVDAEVKQARGSNAQALAQYRQTVLLAAEDVEDSFVTLSQTQVRIVRLQNEVDALQHARDLSQQAYRAGAIPLTDVLDADRQLLATQDDLAQSHADAARAAVRSFRALGGGWHM